MAAARDGMMAGLRGLVSSADAKSHYDNWAPRYDQDLTENYGYIAPSLIANALSKDQVSKEQSILDAGCGTGLVGAELKKRGYINLYGADFSDGMRAIAETKSVYRRLISADFSKRTTILDGVYDTLVAADTFGPGQFSTPSLDELIRLIRRGGYIYALVEAEFFESAKFTSVIADLEHRGRWSVARVLSVNLMKNAVRSAKLIVAQRI